MIQIEESIISHLIMHRIKNGEENSVLSESEFEYADEEEEKVLKKIFLKERPVTFSCYRAFYFAL